MKENNSLNTSKKFLNNSASLPIIRSSSQRRANNLNSKKSYKIS